MHDTELSLVWHGAVAEITLDRGPFNFLDIHLLGALADRFDALSADPRCRAIILRTEGRAFSAGANFQATDTDGLDPSLFYVQALRLFEVPKPVIAAVQGPAVGAGLGLALCADFRVASQEAYFCANFNRLGFHPGFGMTETLPRVVGRQYAALMFYTARKVGATEAKRVGLIDELSPAEELRQSAIALAQEIATSAPAAVQSTKAELMADLVARVRAFNQRECEIQREQFAHPNFHEGIAAAREKRVPRFADY